MAVDGELEDNALQERLHLERPAMKFRETTGQRQEFNCTTSVIFGLDKMHILYPLVSNVAMMMMMMMMMMTLGSIAAGGCSVLNPGWEKDVGVCSVRRYMKPWYKNGSNDSSSGHLKCLFQALIRGYCVVTVVVDCVAYRELLWSWATSLERSSGAV